MERTGQAVLVAGSRTLLLSIKPAFAEMVLAGRKTVELRRVRPSVDPGMPLLLYASSPRRQLVATGRIADVAWGSPDEVWEAYGADTGVPRAFFDDYFAGSPRAVAILVEDVRPLAAPVALDDLRDRLESFHPPQSFRYLTGRDVDRLLARQRHPTNGATRRRSKPSIQSRG